MDGTTTGASDRERYPVVEPHASGMLDVGDGQRVFWEVSGNPDGKPAVVLHGGPGSGSTPGARRDFDPALWRIVQFDQRGCGRSTPHVSSFETDLSANTTHHLIEDIERLREHLGIDRWLVYGGSWGVTLALAYAERHPERVTEMILASVTLTRPTDVRWFSRGAGRFFPEQWARFRDGVPEADRDGDLVAAYDRLINADPDHEVRERAILDWIAWEDALLSLDEGYAVPNPRWEERRHRVAFARLVTHYFANAAFLEEGELLRNADRLSAIPAVLVHGRLDLGGPPSVAWDLAGAWPGAELHLVGTGHTGGAEASALVLEATDRFARQG